MKKLLDLADQYIAESDWKVITILKFCLLSLGILIGMTVPKKYKKPVQYGCLFIFVVTYVPLIGKLVKLILKNTES